MTNPIGTSPAISIVGDIRPSDLPDPRRLAADLDPFTRELLDRAARTTRLRADSTRTLLQWKTARRLRIQRELRRAA